MKTNENAVVKQSCHSRMSLSGIFRVLSRCAHKAKALFINNKYVEDPRLQASGMTANVRGFTLIELLVVVLIIGILAAVAVPQYKLAVTKSRVQSMIPIISNIAKVDRIYYLANGIYTPNINNLDISMPKGCKNLTGEQAAGGAVGQVWSCGKDFVIDNSSGRWITLMFCPGQNNTYSSCNSSKIIRIYTDANNLEHYYSCQGDTKLCKALKL